MGQGRGEGDERAEGTVGATNDTSNHCQTTVALLLLPVYTYRTPAVLLLYHNHEKI